MLRKEAARQCGNITTPKKNPMVHDTNIIHNFERGTFYGGLLIAVFFGLLMIHAAVML